jgi:hypothetical protein
MEMNKHQEIVEAFCKECMWAWVAYEQYLKLFEKGEARLNLLDKVASRFFGDLNTIMIGYLLTQICKLTDPAKTLGNPNLTTNYLVEYLPWPPDVKEELLKISLKLVSFRKYIVDARNKILSHNDLTTIVKGNTLGAFPAGEEKVFWDNLQNFVSIAYGHYFGNIYPINAVSQYDADDLIEALKKSIDYDEYFVDKPDIKFTRRGKMTFKEA